MILNSWHCPSLHIRIVQLNCVIFHYRLKIRYRDYRELPPTRSRKLIWTNVQCSSFCHFYQRTISSGQFVAIVSQVVQFWLVWWTNEQNGSIHPSNSKRLNGGTRKLFSPANKWSSSSHHHSPSLLLSGIGIFRRSRIGSLPGSGHRFIYEWRSMKEIICPAPSLPLEYYKYRQRMDLYLAPHP